MKMIKLLVYIYGVKLTDIMLVSEMRCFHCEIPFTLNQERQIYIHMYMLFQIIFHCTLLQDVESPMLCTRSLLFICFVCGSGYIPKG